MKMSKKIFSVICLFSAFVAGFLLRGLDVPVFVDIAPTVQAQAERDGSGRCSNRTLKGAYGIRFEGQKLNTGPFVSVSRVTFDGEGRFTTNEIGRFNGNLIQRTFTGPYTVNEDCTGFLDFSSTISNPPHEAHGNFIIVNEGREFFIVDNEDGWAATGHGAKL
jgi:hypothetical protein